MRKRMTATVIATVAAIKICFVFLVCYYCAFGHPKCLWTMNTVMDDIVENNRRHLTSPGGVGPTF